MVEVRLRDFTGNTCLLMGTESTVGAAPALVKGVQGRLEARTEP